MAVVNIKVKLENEDALQKIGAIQKEFAKMSSGSNKGVGVTGASTANINKEVTAVNNLQKQYATLLSTIDRIAHKYPQGTFSGITSKINDQYNAVKKTAEAVNKANAVTKDQAEVVDKAKVSLSQYGAEVASLATETPKLTTAVIEQGDSISGLASKFVLWQLAATLVMQPIQKLRQLLSDLNTTLVETEDMVIGIKRVLNEDISGSSISTELFQIGEQYGQVIDNVREISLNFARTGMSWSDTLKATESALIAMNVAELDATESSDGLIAVMTQFKLQAEDLTGVIDMLNKTADNYPVTTEKLLKALQRTGSAAVNARMELSDTIGVITALSKATGRSGENLGTAVNSLIQYSTKGKALDLFAGLNADTARAVESYKMGMGSILDIWREVGKYIQSANEEQKNLLANNTELQELSEELHDELGDIYETEQKVYGVANTFRKNYFIALMQDIQTADEAAETASGALGYSMQENAKYMETYTAKVNTLKTAWKEMLNDSQGFLAFKKTLVDIGIGLTSFTKNVGGVKTLLLTLATVFTVLTGKGNLLITAFTKIGHTLSTAGHNILNLRRAYTTASEAQQYAIAMEGVYDAAVKKGIATQEMETLKVEANTAAQKANAAARAATVSWIMIGVTALAMIAGAIKSYNAEQEREREATIQNWKSNEEKAESLKKLSDRYDALNKKTNKSAEENAELKKVETDLVDLLGDKKKALGDLTQGTKEYTKAVENMTDAELTSLEAERIAAQTASEKAVKKVKNNAAFGYAAQYIGDSYSAGTSDEDMYKIYLDLLEKIESETKEYNKAVINGETEKAEALKQTISWLVNVKKEVEDTFETWAKLHPEIVKTTEAEEENTDATNDNTKATDDNNKSKKEAIETLDKLSKSLDVLSGAAKDFNKEGGVSYSTLSKIREEFSDVTDIDNYIDKLANANLTAEEFGQVLSDLTYKQIESKYSTEELANADANLIAKMLEEKGVTNSLEVATQLVANAKIKHGVQSLNAASNLAVEIEKLKQEGIQAGYTENEIKDLIAQMITFSNTNLNVGQKITALLNLGYAADVARAKIMAIQNDGSGRDSEGRRLADKGWTPTPSLPKIEYGSVGSGGGGGGGGGGNKKDEKLEALKNAVSLEEKRYNLYEKEGKSVEELAAQAEVVKSSYKDLEEYLSNSNASEADIIDAQIKQYDWQEKIQKLYEDEQKRIEEANKKEKEKYEARIALYNVELSILEQQNAPLSERIAKHKQIQEELHKEAEFLRSISADEKEIKDIQDKWLQTQTKINNLLLEDVRNRKSVHESELGLLEAQNASIEERIAKKKQIQADLHEEAELLRQIQREEGYTDERQADINKKSEEWLKIQKEILDIYKDAIKSAQQLRIDALQAEIDSLEKARDIENDRLNLEEKRLAVLEAEKAVQDAMNKRDTKVYNAKTGKWEWQANPKNVQSARDNLSSAQKAYKDAQTTSKINALKMEQERRNTETESLLNGTLSSKSVVKIMQAISGLWLGANDNDQRTLHNGNLALGKSIGATYGKGTGEYTYADGSKVYSNPALSNQLLKGASTTQYNDFVNRLGLMFGAGNPTPSTGNVVYRNDSTNYDNRQYSVNGVPITSDMAETYTITQLFEAMRIS